jgi:hypothetical protein
MNGEPRVLSGGRQHGLPPASGYDYSWGAQMRGLLAQHDGSGQVVVRPSRAELQLLAGSVNGAIEAVPDWEFPARLCAGKASARLLRTELGDLIAGLPPE